MPVCNGTFDYEHYQRTMPTYTFGANYVFSHNMSAYVRINNGVVFQNFDGIANTKHNTPPIFHPIETAHNVTAWLTLEHVGQRYNGNYGQ